MSEVVTERVELHYYFDDDSHTMNAFLRNKAEKDFLEAIRKLADVYDSNVFIETEAYQEGGLKEFLVIVFSSTAFYLQPTINDTLTHYLTKDSTLEELQKIHIEKEIKSKELDNQKKEIENRILENKLVTRSVSNFYKTLDNYEKIKKIGIKRVDIDNTEEYIVEKRNFKNYILVDEQDVVEDDNAMVEIISPILKEGKYKWKGIYNGNKIEFSMGDASFKEEVISGKHMFSSGNSIFCKLVVLITYDEFGDEKRKTYSVKKVYGKQDSDLAPMNLRTAGVVKKKQDWEKKHQSNLFDYIDE